MKKNYKIAYLVLFVSIIIIIIGCKSKQRITEYMNANQIEKVQIAEERKDIIHTTKIDKVDNKNIVIEYKGEHKDDSLSITTNPNSIIISGKGNLLYNYVSNKSAVEETKDSKLVVKVDTNKSIIKEESKKQEELIKKNNGFNLWVIGLMALVILLLLSINYVKNKFKLNG